MNDLNNIRFFAKIVECGSLTAASESLGVAKSMLSQHLAKLEEELGVQLIRRSSRSLQITAIGERYYAQCLVILAEIERAASITESIRLVPRGKLRISCPINFAQIVFAPVLTKFMSSHPEVEVTVDTLNSESAVVDEVYDFSLYIGPKLRSSTLVTSSFNLGREILVASPDLLARWGAPQIPVDLKALPSAAGQLPPEANGRYVWHLSGPEGARESVTHSPRLLTEDLWIIKQSAMEACTIASMPPVMCRTELEDGRLVRVLPQWSLQEHKLHVLYPSKAGLTIAARALIDVLAQHLREQLGALLEGTVEMRSPLEKRA
jgi:DNA-binding transcriptional LysR family regulator